MLELAAICRDGDGVVIMVVPGSPDARSQSQIHALRAGATAGDTLAQAPRGSRLGPLPLPIMGVAE